MRLVLLAAAIFAAIVEHKLTEALANLGAFPRVFGSYDHAAVAPSLVLATLISLVLAAASFYETASRRSVAAWFIRIALRAQTLSLPRAFVSILAMQMTALFSMESIEQLLATGRAEGGTVWLGAPVLAATCIAIVVAFAVACILRSGLSFVVSAVRAVVAVCIDLAILVKPHVRSMVFVAIDRTAHEPAVAVMASRSGLRAPPITL